MIYEGQSFEWTNEGTTFRDILYASVTAPEVTRCEVSLDRDVIDIIYVGNGDSHSWWTHSGGKLLPPEYPNGIPVGATLRFTCDKVAAIRLDFYA